MMSATRHDTTRHGESTRRDRSSASRRRRDRSAEAMSASMGLSSRDRSAYSHCVCTSSTSLAFLAQRMWYSSSCLTETCVSWVAVRVSSTTVCGR